MDKVIKGQRVKTEIPESTARKPQAVPSFRGQAEDGNDQRRPRKISGGS